MEVKKKMKLSDQQQAVLVLLAFVLLPLSVWSGNGMPTDRASVGALVSSLLIGIVLFIKEILGGKPPEVPTPAAPLGGSK